MEAEDKSTLIIFTRIPIAGKVKVRLAPILTFEECALLQEAMALDLAEKLAALGNPIILSYSDEWRSEPDGARVRDGFIDKMRTACSAAPSFTPVAQEGDSLGERMLNAMNAAFSLKAKGCLLMGSDLPDIMRNDIVVAQRALAYSDVVLGPSADGGYWLVGARTPFPQLFESVAYGTDRVLADTVATCRAYGRTVALSRETFDIDVPEDYFLLCKQVNTGDFRLGPRTVEAVRHTMGVSAAGAEGE